MTMPSPHGTSRRLLTTFGALTAATLLSRRALAGKLANAPPVRIRQTNDGTPSGGQTMSESIVVELDVRAFGAVGDGAADDSGAINKAFAFLRKKHAQVGRYDVGYHVVFPPGVYVVYSSINLTNLRGINTKISGAGSVILGRCKGVPILDALGARWLSIEDMTLIGDDLLTPSIGIQMGVVARDVVADDHRLSNVKILGSFSAACLYNRGSETCGFDHLLLWNRSENSFCLIQDGLNHFDARSQFVAAKMAVDCDLSFNENEFINCDFRHQGKGAPVWLGDTARHIFIRCYAATDSNAAFVIHCGQNSHLMLDIDCHCETSSMNTVFVFEGISSKAIVHGFAYRDHRCFARQTVFSTSESLKHVTLENAQISIATVAQATCRVFDDPLRWAVLGAYYCASESAWNGDKVFRGIYIDRKGVSAKRITNQVETCLSVAEVSKLGAGDIGRVLLELSTSRLLTWLGDGWADALGNRVT